MTAHLLHIDRIDAGWVRFRLTCEHPPASDGPWMPRDEYGTPRPDWDPGCWLMSWWEGVDSELLGVLEPPFVWPLPVKPDGNGEDLSLVADLADPAAPIDGKAGSDHESIAAAKTPDHRVVWGHDRQRILSYLASRTIGATAAEVTEHLCATGRQVSRNQTATRLLELREMGCVAYVHDDDGKVLTVPTGPKARGKVQHVTAIGLARLETARRERLRAVS